MSSPFRFLACATLALSACSRSTPQTQPQAQKQRAALTGPGSGTDRLKWVRRDATSPGVVAGAVVAYDEARKRTVVFGGDRNLTHSSGAQVDDTFLWDGARWTLAQPAHRPSRRYGAAGTYDAQRQVVVLYGGFDSAYNLLTDTWIWNGNDWSEQHPAHHPGDDLGDGFVAYDRARQRVVYVGTDENRAVQTWEWDGADWTDATPTDPQLAGAPPLALSTRSAAGGVLLVSYNGTKLDSWNWDGKAWTLLATPHALPGENAVNSLTYDPVRDRVVALPGDMCWRSWEWDGRDWIAPTVAAGDCNIVPSWSNVAPPQLVFDRDRNVLLLPSQPNIPGTWERSADGAWKRVDVGSPLTYGGLLTPPIAFDSKRGRLVLFDESTWDGTVHEFDGTSWSVFGPVAYNLEREGGALAADSVRGRTMSFGGITFNGADIYHPVPRNESCEWDGGQWQCTPWPHEPSWSVVRDFAALSFDSDRKRMVLFGGASCSRDGAVGWRCFPVDRATYEWDGSEWAQRHDGKDGAPPSRQLHALAFDSVRKRTVLFGGTATSREQGPYLGDTWEWDGSQWTELHPATSPPARGGHALVYDAKRGRTVLFGGANFNRVALADVWEWDGHDWLERHPSGSPGPFQHPAMTYDSVRGAPILYGVRDSASDADGVGMWELVADPGGAGSCHGDAECTSGHCVDGVCCDQACGGNDASDCQACSVAAGAATDGVCSPIAKGRSCRAGAGECDEPESCDGEHAACPADGYKPATVTCRASTGACDPAESCSGTSPICPADRRADKTIVCRAAAGPCDRGELCDGITAACPADVLAAAGTACAEATACVAASSCDGAGAACPAGDPAQDGTMCSGGACMGGQCVPETTPPPMAPDMGSVHMEPPPPTGDSGGCSCSTAGAGSGSNGSAAPVLLALAAWWLRRRRAGASV